MSTRSPERSRIAGVRIRTMAPSDLEAVLRIERASFSTPWSERTFRGLLKRGNAVLLVAESAGRGGGGPPGAAPRRRLVGYAVVWFGGGEAELGDLAVEAPARGRGVGSTLLEAALEAARGRGAGSIFLEVRESNLVARRLYERAGFELADRRPAYYVRPVEDALVLRRGLSGGGPDDAFPR